MKNEEYEEEIEKATDEEIEEMKRLYDFNKLSGRIHCIEYQRLMADRSELGKIEKEIEKEAYYRKIFFAGFEMGRMNPEIDRDAMMKWLYGDETYRVCPPGTGMAGIKTDLDPDNLYRNWQQAIQDKFDKQYFDRLEEELNSLE